MSAKGVMPALGLIYSDPSQKLGSCIQLPFTPPFAGGESFNDGLKIDCSLILPVLLLPLGVAEKVLAGEKIFGAVLGVFGTVAFDGSVVLLPGSS